MKKHIIGCVEKGREKKLQQNMEYGGDKEQNAIFAVRAFKRVHYKDIWSNNMELRMDNIYVER